MGDEGLSGGETPRSQSAGEGGGAHGGGPSEGFLESVRRHGVLLLMPSALPAAEEYYYWGWCLTAGLQELGVPVFCNLPELLERRGLKVGPGPRTVPEEIMVVGDVSPIELCEQEGDRLAHYVMARVRRKALLCMSDSANNVTFPESLPVFVAHGSAKLAARGWRIPWAFGLSREIVEKIAAARGAAAGGGAGEKGEGRVPVVLRNFRASANQGVRNALDLSLVKRLAERVAVDRSFIEGPRWNPEYYVRLARALGCLAYGGFFVEDLARREQALGGNTGQCRVLGEEPAIDRWDSWRFWESLASGCVTVGLDFEEYGFQVPIAPVHGVHYVGVKMDRIEEAVELLAGPAERLAEIGENGRRWVMAHYVPRPVALRFLGRMERVEEGR